MRTEPEINALHEAIRYRFPCGLSYEQFKLVTLETADDEGRVYPPPLLEMETFRMLTKMSLFDKLLDYRGTHHTPYIPNHFINQIGRDYLVRALGQGECEKC
jgi:hypothetical protein